MSDRITLPGDIPGLDGPLDLSGRLARTAAAWWLVPHLLDKFGQGHCRYGVIWFPPSRWTEEGAPVKRWKTLRRWLLHGWTSMDCGVCVPAINHEDNWDTERYRHTVVPSLATLDPDDPRVLPDGSRWVDAEALRLVCLHVAGRE